MKIIIYKYSICIKLIKDKVKKKLEKANIFQDNYLFKILFIFILMVSILLLNIYKTYLSKIKVNNSLSYYSCFITMAKLENKYVRELIEHYKKLGLNKFYIADDNSLNSEKLSDVLQDYIDEGYIEILDIREKHYTQKYYFKYSFDKYKSKCKWMLYFDIDEYLEFVDKNITINDYLSQGRFNKCEVIKINWVMYTNDNLLYYDNRSLKERFPNPTYIREDVRAVKSIVRNDSRRNPWVHNSAPHEPAKGLYSCNSIGKYSPFRYGRIYPPILSYCYLKHYHYKTIEEFVFKINKGFNGKKFDIDNKVKIYFERNKYSKEKINLAEKLFNRTFKWLHKKQFNRK